MKIYGILNITPDSFSDGGNHFSLEKAYKQVQKMINEGVDVIDVGGESTRPGATFVETQEEINRVIPVIKMIKENFDILVSIDTYKSEVAKEAIIAGADIINDVQANEFDGKMLELVKEYNVEYVAMHSTESVDLLKDIESCFNRVIRESIELGIDQKLIILDPGIGFHKDMPKNLYLLNNLGYFKEKFPAYKLFLGASRKRFIGTITGTEKADDRIIGTTVTTTLAYLANYDFVRVHDVLENKQAIKMIEAIKSYE